MELWDPNHCLGTGSTDPYTVGPGTEARAGSGIETDTDTEAGLRTGTGQALCLGIFRREGDWGLKFVSVYKNTMDDDDAGDGGDDR